MKKLPSIFGAFTLALSLSAMAQQGDDPFCLEFETISAGDYDVGQSVIENGILMTFATYVNTNGPTSSGVATIFDPQPLPVDQELRFNNINVSIPLACAYVAELNFQHFGGDINIGVNGSQLAPITPAMIPATLGGVNVSLSGSTLTFTRGTQLIDTIVIGGQELIIDDLCWVSCETPNENCFDFELLDGTEFVVGDVIVEEGQTLTVESFDPGTGPIADGVATRSDVDLPGGLGQALELKNTLISTSYDCVSEVKFNYANGGDGVTLIINGEAKTFSEMIEFDNGVLGGAMISVTNAPGSNPEVGLVCIEGLVTSLTLGGERLIVDQLCGTPCGEECIDFEEAPVGSTYASGEIYREDGIEITSTGENVSIENNQRAGHFGQDLFISEGGGFKTSLGCANEVTFHFGQYAGGIRFEIDGNLAEVDEMTELDGVTLGDVEIQVESQTNQSGIIGTVTLTGKLDVLSFRARNLFIDHLCYTPCPDPDCIDFEEQFLGREFTNGQGFVEDGISLRAGPFVLSNGTTISSGLVTIGGENRARHIRHEAALRNATLRWRYNCAEEVSFHYTDEGGNVNLRVDGQLANVADFSSLNGTSLGGALITVTETPVSGGVNGQVTISGITQNFEVGGQELWIDHICHTPCPDEDCIDFEDLPAAETYQVADGAGFMEDGITMKLQAFQTGGSLIEGAITVDDQQRAGHLDQDLSFNNANLAFDIECIQGLNFYYGDYGGLVNLEINDSGLLVINDLADLDGMVFSGSTITVTELAVPGGVIGRVQVSGVVTNFVIGGQEFYLDHVCFDPCPPIVVSPVIMSSGEVNNAGGIDITYEFSITGPGVFTMQKSEDLGLTDVWSTDTSAVITSDGMGNYTINTSIPSATPQSLFHRFRVVPGNPVP